MLEKDPVFRPTAAEALAMLPIGTLSPEKKIVSFFTSSYQNGMHRAKISRKKYVIGKELRVRPDDASEHVSNT